jgi:hypothetical protein
MAARCRAWHHTGCGLGWKEIIMHRAIGWEISP